MLKENQIIWIVTIFPTGNLITTALSSDLLLNKSSKKDILLIQDPQNSYHMFPYSNPSLGSIYLKLSQPTREYLKTLSSIFDINTFGLFSTLYPINGGKHFHESWINSIDLDLDLDLEIDLKNYSKDILFSFLKNKNPSMLGWDNKNKKWKACKLIRVGFDIINI